jgi:uncharacterized protein YbjQ (UPF0145 family)
MVTSEEIRRKLEEKKRAKMAQSSPQKKETPKPSKAPSAPKAEISTPKSPGNLPRPKAPPMRGPVEEERPPATDTTVESTVDTPVETSQDEESVKHCPSCDVDYTNDTNFCPDCGSKLEEVSVTPEASEVMEEEVPMVEEATEEETPADETYDETYEEPATEMEEVKLESIPLNTATFADDIVVVTSNFVPGYKAVETLGFVYGLTVRSRGVGGQIGAGIRSMFGGEIKEYVKMMEESRNQALERMIAHARSMGANAIISSRFDSDQISDIMQEILAYGTAVIIEEEDSL